MRIILGSLLALILIATHCGAANIIIDTVPVGNAGNSPDPSTDNLYGSVNYAYRIGTTEVTNSQYVAFLNAVAATDTYGLYNVLMGSTTRGGITRTGSPGSYVYSVKGDAGSYAYSNKPVIHVNWGDAVRFANWLHNGQPAGAQNASTTEDGAYTLNGAVSPAALNAVTRNSNAVWFLPSEDEWYKAAYHQPAAQGGDSDDYWLYPTGSNLVPNYNPPSLDTGNSANFFNMTGDSSYPFTDAGAYTLSASFYGTYDQGGNVWEWNEAFWSGIYRGIRGGSFTGADAFGQASWYRGGDNPTGDHENFYDIGFRVATVPEPSTFALAAFSLVAFYAWGRERGSSRKQ